MPLQFSPPPPLPLNYLHSAFNYPIHRHQTSFTPVQTADSSFKKSEIHPPVKQDCTNDEDIDIEQHKPIPTPNSEVFSRAKRQSNDPARQIRYYQDRIDFHGDILMKPQAAKSKILFIKDFLLNSLI
jgi:hypothetical protein